MKVTRVYIAGLLWTLFGGINGPNRALFALVDAALIPSQRDASTRAGNVLLPKTEFLLPRSPHVIAFCGQFTKYGKSA